MDFIKKYWIVILVAFGLSIFVKPALCFLILGTLVSYASLNAILFLKHIANNGIDCTGKIVEYQSDSDGDKTPLIEFTTRSGKLIRETPYVYTYTFSSFSFKDSVNQAVPILYDPEDPKKFVLNNERKFDYAAFIIFILLGVFFVGLGVSSILGYIKID